MNQIKLNKNYFSNKIKKMTSVSVATMFFVSTSLSANITHAQSSTSRQLQDYKNWLENSDFKKLTVFEQWLSVRDSFTNEEKLFLDSWALTQKKVKVSEVSNKMIQQSNGEPALRTYFKLNSGVESYFQTQTSMHSLDTELTFKVETADIELTGDENLKYFLEKTSQFKQNSTKQAEFKLSDTENSIPAHIYKAMNETDKTLYLLDRRELIELSYKVLSQTQNSQKVKTSQIDNTHKQLLYEKIQQFLLATVSEVNAQSAQPAPPTGAPPAGGPGGVRPSVAAGGSVGGAEPVLNNNGKKCIDRYGYVGIQQGTSCMVSLLMFKPNVKCAEVDSKICNPYLFGITSNANNGICLSEADLKDNKTCFDIMTLKTNADYKRMQDSLKNSLSLDSTPAQQDLTKAQDQYIQQALQLCESENPKSENCNKLIAKKMIYNSQQVSAQAAATTRPNGIPQQGNKPEGNEKCELWCKTKNFASETYTTTKNVINSNPWYQGLFWAGAALTTWWLGKKIYNRFFKSKTLASSSSSSSTVSTTDVTGTVQSTLKPTLQTPVDFTGYVQ